MQTQAQITLPSSNISAAHTSGTTFAPFLIQVANMGGGATP